MRGMRIASVAMALGVFALNHSAKAQTTYTVVPSQCGTAVNLMQCIVDLSPANSLGFYPTLHITDSLTASTGGLVDWTTTLGPTGKYLGGGVIEQDSSGHYLSYPIWSKVCSNGLCSEQVTALTVYFDGSYIGGGLYGGCVTLHMSYRSQYSYPGGWKWIRTVSGGLVTLTK